ncbi:MAG: F420-dependent oxidoreductase, family [Phycisphaerales bacterium]|nr:F420-dependent oxidoreductase, family [Phycisphaerales bacterium]
MATSKVGFHASHELYPPSVLLELARRAERAGFAHGMCSDHFHPWTERQGQSGFAWSWLGAALQATGMPYGMVCAPGQRYHPAIIAQAAATLGEMFPGRVWVSVGTGQALNEHITGDPWPPKPERQARLRAAVEVLRALWAGETVTRRDGPVRVAEAKLYTRPAEPPPVFGAALTAETARWVGGWADGLITAAKPPADLRQTLDAFREGGGSGKPVFVQAAVSYAPTEAEAASAALANWPVCGCQISELEDLPTPQAFARASAGTTADDVRAKLRVSADLRQHADWIRQDLELGVTRVYLHHVGPDMPRFIGAFGEHVLPVVG